MLQIFFQSILFDTSLFANILYFYQTNNVIFFNNYKILVADVLLFTTFLRLFHVSFFKYTTQF